MCYAVAGAARPTTADSSVAAARARHSPVLWEQPYAAATQLHRSACPERLIFSQESCAGLQHTGNG